MLFVSPAAIRPLLWSTILFMLCAPRSAAAYRYVHEVLPGERIEQIAKRYHVSTKRIRRLNRLRRNALRAGQRLKVVTSVPSRTLRKMAYVIKKGDSLSRIARKFKMRVWLLRRLNARRLRKRSLKPGKKLWVVVEGPSPKGRVKGLYQLEGGPSYKVRNRRRAWGTFLTVLRIHDVLTSYAERFPRAPLLRVFDLSRRGGGYLKPHKSHRQGRDVDISYPLKKAYKGRVRATPAILDAKRAWYVIKAFVDTGDVRFIFIDYSLQKVLYSYAVKHGAPAAWLKKVFQYPRGHRAAAGIIRDEPGHATHFHVRFRREGPRAVASHKQSQPLALLVR